MTEPTTDGRAGGIVRYSDGIAAARTLIALEANAIAMERRLPDGWDLAPYADDDLRGKAFRGAAICFDPGAAQTLMPYCELRSKLVPRIASLACRW